MNVPMVATNADFERLSWHDSRIWGIEIKTADGPPDTIADLVFQIDVVTGWTQGPDGTSTMAFRPATLAFHMVTEPVIDLASESHGYRVLLHEISVEGIERWEQPEEERANPGHPYYVWRITTTMPEGEITFGAKGFTQTLHDGSGVGQP